MTCMQCIPRIITHSRAGVNREKQPGRLDVLVQLHPGNRRLNNNVHAAITESASENFTSSVYNSGTQLSGHAFSHAAV